MYKTIRTIFSFLYQVPNYKLLAIKHLIFILVEFNFHIFNGLDSNMICIQLYFYEPWSTSINILFQNMKLKHLSFK